MPYTVVDKGSNYFDTNLYTGNNTARNITLNFSPDFVWIRSRDTGGTNHFLQDSVRGTSKIIYTNLTNAETTFTDGYVSSFNSNGYSLTTDTTGYMNYNARTYVGWSWRGSDSSAVSNTSGTITSTVSANTTSGFSIVSYTGTGANATVGHGLGVTPKMIIVKRRDSATNGDWFTYTATTGNGNVLFLNLTNSSSASAGAWNNTSPTSSLFSLGTSSGVNGNGSTYIAYCFADVKGFSKFASYTGNGSTDGTFVYTGFKPSFIMLKRTDSTSSWAMYDNKRSAYNVMNIRLLANTDGADDTSADNNIDFVSNGIKFRTSVGWNASGATYIYMAFAESPFVSSKGLPTTAR